jgi:hypothetical protein
LATLDGENRKRDGEEMSQAISVLSTLSVRPKDETREEKTVRKLALKDYRRVSSLTRQEDHHKKLITTHYFNRNEELKGRPTSWHSRRRP